MAKYLQKAALVEAEMFKEGMEDGYAVYHPHNDELVGYFSKHFAPPKGRKITAIKTADFWDVALPGKHYVITKENGERYSVEKSKFEEKHFPVSDEKYYFITYAYRTRSGEWHNENAAIFVHPIEWLKDALTNYDDCEYKLLFYEEIDLEQYRMIADYVG